MKRPNVYSDSGKGKEKEGRGDEHPDRGKCGSGAPAKVGGRSGDELNVPRDCEVSRIGGRFSRKFHLLVLELALSDAPPG
jgi:hypothetical protein